MHLRWNRSIPCLATRYVAQASSRCPHWSSFILAAVDQLFKLDAWHQGYHWKLVCIRRKSIRPSLLWSAIPARIRRKSITGQLREQRRSAAPIEQRRSPVQGWFSKRITMDFGEAGLDLSVTCKHGASARWMGPTTATTAGLISQDNNDGFWRGWTWFEFFSRWSHGGT